MVPFRASVAGIVFALSACATVKPTPPHPPESRRPGSLSSGQALARLKRGNARFAHDHTRHPDQNMKRVHTLVMGQHPFAAVVCCADSRVSPEIVFDEGLGDLFVVREAGHVADDATVGSIEYAVHHLGVPLVVVLGHEGCGAVAATIEAMERHQRGEGHISRLVADIRPAVREARKGHEGALIDRAVACNVDLVVKRLAASHPFLREANANGGIRIVGAVYDLHRGTIRWR